MSAAAEILAGRGRRRGVLQLLPFLGPAFVASVAYIDPGNFATNIQGGSEFGYRLVWVVLASNLIAMLVQALSAKLGIATGRNLAEMCRERFSRPVVWTLWILMEGVAMATDLAEFLGAAIGFNLLFGMPLLPAALLTGICTLVILALEQQGFRPVEAVITTLVGVIAGCYLVETVLDRPSWGAVAASIVHPMLGGPEAVLLAVGILGATVMPHVIFLHSALTQRRVATENAEQAKRLVRFELADVVIAMTIAGLINAAMLVMAASTFWGHGLTKVASIEEAHKTLAPLLGPASSAVFAVSLLASGLSSSTVGTMAGQIVMQGFLHRQISIWLRRLITMAPAIAVIALGLDPTRTLVISQVILSFGLPFALVPLVLFTRRRDLMGPLANGWLVSVAAVLVTAFIIGLNLFLIVQTIRGG
ncbi:MAG TPA: Nramp family divalent metal transporter [Gaiellales bacterium]|nr:Nramp family divalent metal transporter [Gaiellales bacterium]